MKKLLFVLVILVFMGCATQKKGAVQTTFYPPLPQTPKLQFLVSISDESDLGFKQGELTKYLYGKVAAAKRIARPVGIGSSKGKIYVSDKTYGEILYMDLEKKSFNQIVDEGMGRIKVPFGIWVTEDDYKYIADIGRKQVLLYDNNNKYVRAYGNKDLFEKPLDVAVYENRIYVCDQKKNVVYVLDKDSGETIQVLGGEVSRADGMFYKPSYVTVDQKGNVYINDAFNFRVQVFDPEGNFVSKIGYAGDTLGSFARPKGVAVDRSDHLYAVDTAFENVQIFDAKTTFLLLYFGGYQTGPGSMYMPHSIHIDYDNVEYFQEYADKNFEIEYLIYVGNTLGFRKLNVYAFGNWVGPPPSDGSM